MTVNSLAFLLFFIAVAVVYYLPVLRKYQWVVLLIASYIFYLSFGVHSIYYILLTTVSTYLAARSLETLQEKLKNAKASRGKDSQGMSDSEFKEYKEKNKKQRNRVVFLHVLVNIGILVILKYSDFFIVNANMLLQGTAQFDALNLIVPIGISYYTLQSIGYVVDVSKGKVHCEKNLGKTALFVSYFPQITQGPIGRFGQLAGQLFSSHDFSYHNLSFGCQRLLWGYFKKMVIADRMNPVVDEIFLNYQQYGGMTLFLGCVYMTIQIYADFSGYMDIIAGFSEILGIQVAENFKRPFFSKSLAEYWRRWHITLGGWFRDYVFYSLSLSKIAVKLGRSGKKHLPLRVAKLIPSVYALFIVWFCTGFWHAASWRYILWGVCNGVIIILSTCLAPEYEAAKKKLHIRDNSKAWQLFQMLRTFFIICLLKVFPGADSTQASLNIAGKLFTEFKIQFNYEAWFPGLLRSHLPYILFGLIWFFVVSYIQERRSVREWLSAKPFAVRWALYLTLMCSILGFGVLATDISGGFEYAQF